MESVHSDSVVRFDAFELDACDGTLRKAGAVVKLQPRPFKVLALMAHHPGQLVSREDIRAELWGDETFVDFDQGINACIKQIRTALGDDAESPRFIETVPRRGYRIIVPVQQVHRVAQTNAPLKGTATAAKAPSRLRYYMNAAVAVVLLAAGLWLVWLRGSHPKTTASRNISIAVLPFNNLNGDPQQEYFAEGMTDALITNLARLEALRVISRNSSMRFKDARKSTAEIAQELQANVLVQGSVLRSGNRIRITVQLVDSIADRHLWAEVYERDLEDVLELQNSVTKDIVHQVQLSLTQQEQTRLGSARRVNPRALEAYLRGRYFWNKRSGVSLAKANEYFQEALRVDPSYALAYAGLADACNVLGKYAEAKTAALRALAIDDSMGEAHASLAYATMMLDWDWIAAETEFKRATELAPSYPTAHQWYAHFLTAQGRHDEAIREASVARDLDPLSLIIRENLAWQLYMSRRFPEAIEQLQAVLDLEPDFMPALESLGLALVMTGEHKSAIQKLRQAGQVSQDRTVADALLGYAYAVSGNKNRARRAFEELKHRSRMESVSPTLMAGICAALGAIDEAFLWLEQAYAQRSGDLIWLKANPMLDPLRQDPRFHGFLVRLGVES